MDNHDSVKNIEDRLNSLLMTYQQKAMIERNDWQGQFLDGVVHGMRQAKREVTKFFDE